MLKTFSETLSEANGAVGCFNIVDLGMAQAVAAAAEQEGAPAIIGVAARHWRAIDGAVYAPSLRAIAERSSVPIALHLDHAGPDETGLIQEALGVGFTSIMIDGSKLPFEDNCAVTRRVVELARPYNAGVEAELGAIAGEEGVAGLVDAGSDETMFTDPGMAQEFVKRCDIDALAVSIGTAHGLYKAEPKLQFELVSELRRRVSVPLVMHGASGIPEEAVAESVRRGIRKINYFSGFLVEAMNEVRASGSEGDTDYPAFRNRLIARWTADAADKIRLYSAGQ
ncbi:MAG: class II fructose-bisphosphate aldolase [Spirochaetia bacterium]